MSSTSTTLKVAKVTAKKSFFFDADENPRKAFVVNGDELLAHAADEGMVCAVYIGKNGVQTQGWLKASDVTVRDVKPLPLEQWLGDWNIGKWANLTLRKGSKPGWIKVSGEAFWASSEEAALNGGLNSGGLDSEAPLEKGFIGFTQTNDGAYKPWSEKARDNLECAVLAVAVSKSYLLVEDSGNCGGHNVRFSGAYVRGKVKFE